MRKKFLFSLLTLLLCSVGAWAATYTEGDLVYECDFENNKAKVISTTIDWSQVESLESITVPKQIYAPGTNGWPQWFTVNAIGTDAFKDAKLKRLYLPSGIKTLAYNCFNSALIDNIFLRAYDAPTVGTLGMGSHKPHLFVPDRACYIDDRDWTNQFNRISRIYDVIVDGVALAYTEGCTYVVEKEEPYTGDVVIPDYAEINGIVHEVGFIDGGVFDDSGDQMKSLTLGTNINIVGWQFLKGVKLETLICKSILPPSYGETLRYSMDWGEGLEIGQILVPHKTMEDYRTCGGWSCYADKIFSIPVVIDGIKYQFEQKTGEAIVIANDYKGDITIPDVVTDYTYYSSGWNFRVTEIKDNAFRGSQIRSIVLPKTLEKIPNNCFENCYNLEYVRLLDGFKSLPNACFSGCTALKYIYMPEGLESVGMLCFYDCSSLKTLTFPASVKKLGTEFFYCSGVKDLEFVNPAPELDDCIYSALLSDWYGEYWNGVYECTLHVPTDLVEVYREKKHWKQFKYVTDGPACKHWFENPIWLWEDYEGAPAYAIFECEKCNYRSEKITANLSDKKLGIYPSCTNTGTYEIEASATSPDGTTYYTSKTFIEPARHTSTTGYCEYCDQYILDYLAFKALEGDVIMAKPEAVSLQYSADRMNWNDMESDVTIPVGSTYFFRNASDEVATDMANTTLSLTSKKGKVAASGNIMSLLDKTCESVTVGDNGFKNLFKDCTILTTAPELPAMTLGQSAYESMFSGCTSLNSDFELPAETASQDCYKNMFYGCSSMSSIIITRANMKDDDVTAVCTDWITGTATPKVYVTFGWQSNRCFDLFTDASEDKATLAFIQRTRNEYQNYYDEYQFAWGKPYKELLAERLIIDRSMTNDGWYSICLPFDVKVEETPFSTAAEFKGMNNNGFKFRTVTEMKAGTAYIVQVDSDVPQLQFWNVTIPSFISPIGTLIDDKVAFRGTFQKAELSSINCAVIGTGNTVNPVNDGIIMGYRAFFVFAENENPFTTAGAKALYFTVDDDDATPISKIDSDINMSKDSYNLQGQRVNASYRGVIIKNGKKILNK